MKKKIVVLTDSVALPRDYKSGIVKWEETYLYKLKNYSTNFEVINLSLGGGSIKDIRNQINYYKILRPEVVILHCGIVDAAPRAFGRLEIEIIKKLRLFRFSQPFISFLRKYRSHHYTNPKMFEKILLDIRKEFGSKYFFSIGIIPSCDDYEKKLPGISKCISIYNNVLEKNTIFISLDGIPREAVLDDFHHINELGQSYIYNKIIEKLIECGIS